MSARIVTFLAALIGAAACSGNCAVAAEPGSTFVPLPAPRAAFASCVTDMTPFAVRAFRRELDLAAHAYGVRPAFLRAVVACESNFNVQAQSKAGARGLAQVMPATAAEMGVHPDLLWIPRYNLHSSAKYIRQLSDKYGNDLDKVLIGYNAGPGYIGSGKTLPQETILFLSRVKSAYRHFLGEERLLSALGYQAAE
jgi:soluble lytic murein transglycosylase-like protein